VYAAVPDAPKNGLA